MIVGELAVGDEDAFGRAAAHRGATGGEIHRAAIDEAEVDDDVREDTS
jgi:hypothetical protein